MPELRTRRGYRKAPGANLLPLTDPRVIVHTALLYQQVPETISSFRSECILSDAANTNTVVTFVVVMNGK